MDFSNKIGNIRTNRNQVSFSGQKAIRNNEGKKVTRFYPPYIKIDKNKEELGIELVRMANTADKNGADTPYNWSVISEKPIRVEVDKEFASGSKTYFDVDLASFKYRMPKGEVGYRYVVYEKDDSKPLSEKVIAKTPDGKEKVYTDSVGSKVKDNLGSFTVLLQNQGTPRLEGTMEHIYIDSYNVVQKKIAEESGKANPDSDDYMDKIDSQRRNHYNKFGGTINGVTEKLDTELRGVDLIMTNPVIGGSFNDSHNYHPTNLFRISQGIGTKSDLMKLITKGFKLGKGYVLDGAFTSQGYGGLQLSHALKWKDSKFKYWFKNPSEGGFELGVLPDTTNANTGIRIVNPKGVKDYDYDPNMPTYIQFYDTRLVDKEDLEKKDELITNYSKVNTDDPYEFTTHQDGVLRNFFEVDPNAKPFYGHDYGSLAEWAKNGDLTDILQPENLPYRFTTKNEVGGLTGWDGNIDLVKLNLSNHINDDNMKEGSVQARNYMCNVGTYWTTEARNAILHDVANETHNAREANQDDSEVKKYLSSVEKTYKREKGSLFDIYQKIRTERRLEDKESLQAKAPKSYHYNICDDKRDADTYLLDKMLGFPLETLDFSPELLAILSTPMITPRPGKDMKPTASKTEIFEYATSKEARTKLAPSMEKVYKETLPTAIKTLMYDTQKRVIDDEGKYGSRKRLFEFDGDHIANFTPYGKYFLEMASSDIMTFLMTEGLFGDDKDIFDEDAPIEVPVYIDGQLEYGILDEKNDTKGFGKRMTLNRLKINETSQENEAEAVAKKLKKGLETLKQKKPKEYERFLDYLGEKYMSLDLEDYKMAEAVVDQTGAGLNWRFDAAKDVADWDEVKEGQITPQQAWQDVMSFWGDFMGGTRKVNPSSYAIGEVTSIGDFDQYGWGIYTGENNGEEGLWNSQKPENTFYEETGVTTGSNYSTFFGLYPKLFGKNIEEGAVENYRSIDQFLAKAAKFILPPGNGNNSAEFILGSHVFLDNHDKPRAAHLMGVDADLFWSDFKRNGKLDPKLTKKAEEVLGRKYSDNMSSKAVAVADKYLTYFDKHATELGLSDNTKKLIQKSIIGVANGYKFNDPDAKQPSYKKAEGFAMTAFNKSITHVIMQAEKFGVKLTPQEKKYLANEVRKDMVRPYESKMTAIYELMRGTVGIPTLFAGDEFAQTGGERKSKNWDLGCRDMVRHDWINENVQEDVLDFNTRIQEINLLGKEDDDMGALANGTPIVCREIKPEIFEIKKGDELISSLEFIGNNNVKDIAEACPFTAAVDSKVPKKEDGSYNFDAVNSMNDADKNALKEAIIAELKSMDKGELETKYEAALNSVQGTNKGLYGWLKQNTTKESTEGKKDYELGAIYKYNDKGEGVITAVTNKYIPDSPDPQPLLTRNEVKDPPKVSELVLKDANGNLIAEPGTIFVRKVYDADKGAYVDDTTNGNYRYMPDGTLQNVNGNETTFDSTVTYFYKQMPKDFDTSDK